MSTNSLFSENLLENFTEAIKIVKSLTEPSAVVEAPEAEVEDADGVPSEVGSEAAEGGAGGGAGPPSAVVLEVDDIEAEVVLARSNAILIARYLHRCSTRALDVVLM